MTIQHTPRLLSLDILRAISIIAVIYYHYMGFSVGLYGVSLFFIISGYCIAVSASQSSTPWHFYSKRLGRLIPALIVCGAITVFLKQSFEIAPNRYADWQDLIFTIIGLPTMNFLGLEYNHPDGAYWSLVIEFKFYILVAITLSFTRKRLLEAAIILSLLITISKYYWNPGFLSFTPYLPYFIAGMGFKAFFEDNQKQMSAIALAASLAIAIICLIANITHNSIPTNIDSFIAFIVCCTIFFLIRQLIEVKLKKENLLIKFLTTIGLTSYPLYLLHQDIGLIVENLVRKHAEFIEISLFNAIATPLAMFALAYFIHSIIEKNTQKKVTSIIYQLPRLSLKILGLKAKSQIHLFIINSSLLLVLTALILLTLRTLDHNNVIQAVASVQSKSNSSPWGKIAYHKSSNGYVVDILNVPSSSCASLLMQISTLPQVKRVASSFDSKDEMKTPISWPDSELRCLNFNKKSVRAFFKTI